MIKIMSKISLFLIILLQSSLAFAQAKPVLNPGDASWMLTSTALVLLMTIPGLALFYGGLVGKKNIVSTISQSFMITCVVTLVWLEIYLQFCLKWGKQSRLNALKFRLH